MSIPLFANPVDQLHRSSLIPYDDGRRQWFLVTDPEVPLEEVAHAFKNSYEQAQRYATLGQVERYYSLQEIKGDKFLCVWFENAYLLKPWERS